MLHEENYDVGADLGGYVPGLQNKPSSSVHFNPTIRREIVEAVSANATDVANGKHSDCELRSVQSTWTVCQALSHLQLRRQTRLGNQLKQSSQLPQYSAIRTKTNLSSFSALNIDNTTGDSVLDYGTRNWAVRYNGSIYSDLDTEFFD